VAVVKILSNITETDSTDKFTDAVTWVLPEIKGTLVKNNSKRKKLIDIDDVKLFEERIKQQIEAIKKEKDNPTYLTVKQIEDVQKQAYDEAYKEAYEKGIAESEKFLENKLQEERKELKNKANQLQQCFNTLSRPLQDIDLEVEQKLTDIVFYFCKQLLGHELNEDSSHILRLIQQSVASLPVAQRNITVKLNPSDIQLLKDGEVDINDQDWKVEVDENIAKGGCIINTSTSSVDLGIENRIKKLTSQLYAGLTEPEDISLKIDDDDEGLNTDLEIEDE
jgi:flagellar assembly protein FliH